MIITNNRIIDTVNKINNNKIIYFKNSILMFLGLLLFSACSTKSSNENKSVDDIYKEAKRLLDKSDLYEAKKYFDIIKLQYPASSFADDAQFYLAEIEFKNEKYIMSSFNYNLVKKLYPNSLFIKESQFKSALCYYKLSPNFERDLEYTKKAITALNEFQNMYTEDSLSLVSDSLIKELRNNLAAREYNTGMLYQKLKSPKAAVIYFDSIINDFDDTSFLEKAYVSKIESFMYMQKFENAKTIIDLYKQKFTNGEMISDIQSFEKQIALSKK